MTERRAGIDTAAFAAGLALLPFARPWSVSVLGKPLLLADLLFAISAVLLAVALARGRRKLRLSGFHVVLGACVASVVISVLAADQVTRSAALAVQRMYAMGLAVIAFHVVTDAAELRMAVKAWVAGGIVSAIVMVSGALAFFAGARDPAVNPTIWNMGSLPDVGLPRVTGLMANANAACNLLVSTAAIAAGLLAARDARPRWWLAGAALFGVAAAFTMSPGLGGLALLIGAVSWQMLGGGRFRWLAGTVLGGGVLAAVLMFLVTSVRLDAPEGASWASSRLLAWRSSFDTFMSDPLLGRGVGLEVASVEFQTPRGVREHLTSAHNAWLSIAAQQGLVGVATTVLLFGWLGRRAWSLRLRDHRSAVALGLALALFVVHGYQSLSMALENQRHLWIAVGLLAACVDGLPDANVLTTRASTAVAATEAR